MLDSAEVERGKAEVEREKVDGGIGREERESG